MNTGSLYSLAWRIIPRLPMRLLYAVSNAAADVVWAANGASVRQMHANYESLVGSAVSRRDVRLGVRSYFRCFAQQFALPGWSAKQLRSSVVYPRAEQTKQLMESGPVVLALTHSGNWDLAGAWFCQNYGPILTVAEKLEPAELFDQFVQFRESLGMEIIGVGPGDHIFGELVEKARDRSILVPLLADRDISGRGIEVKLGESPALVAAGPAALAVALDRPLIAGHISYQKRGSNWVAHAHFTPPIPKPEPKGGQTLVEAWTEAWVKEVGPIMKKYLVDWHMMQKVFVKDLDAKRLERARQRLKEEGES